MAGLLQLHESLNGRKTATAATGDGGGGGNAELVTAAEELEMLEESPEDGDMITSVNQSIVPHSRKLAFVFSCCGRRDCPGCPGGSQLMTKAAYDSLVEARKKVDTDPSEAQIEAGNYAKGHTTIHGLPVTLENPKGSTRSGTDRDGKSWSIKMKHDYGYINRTEGKDGDHVDVFIGPDPETELIYVVNQTTATGAFDEHKCLFGFPTEEKAKAGYLANYQKGWDRIGSIYPITVPQFKWWLEHGDTTKEIKDGMFAKHRRKKSEVQSLQAVTDDEDFWGSPPNKEGRKCPGCDRLFKEVEPLPGVKMCEACERFGPTKRSDCHGVSQNDAKAFFEYEVWNNEENRDSGEIIYLSEKEVKRLAGEWVRLPPEGKLRYHRKLAAEEFRPSVAVDLDGTLAVELDEFDPAVIGDPRPGAKKHMKSFRDAGARIIVHTVRGDDEVTAVWLDKHDIPYDFINKNPDQPEGSSDKLMATVYWDNRAVNAEGRLAESASDVLRRLNREKTSLFDLHKAIGGNGNSPYWQRSLVNQIQYPTWNPHSGVLDNLLGNLNEAKDRAQRQIADKDFQLDFRSALKPGFALRRFQRFMRHGDHVSDPVDQVLFRGNS